MTLIIAQENPLTEQARALIEGSEAALRAVYTVDECFTFTPEELDRSNIQFFVARIEGEPLGCVALCACDDYVEIKRLFVTPNARGSGVARELIHHIETQALVAGHKIVRLETGQKLAAGVALYKNLGYHERGPFGDYPNHPASLFMEKTL